MAAAASSTTNRLSDTATSRFCWPLSRSRASTIDCVNARSFGALGATPATRRGLAAPPVGLVPWLGVVSLPQAVAISSVIAVRIVKRIHLVLMIPPSSRDSSRASSSSSSVRSGQSRRLSETPRHDDQRDDGEHRRRHPRQIGSAPRNDAQRLPREDRGRDHPVQERPTHHAVRTPRTEVDQGDGDEPLSLGQILLEDAELQGKRRPRQAGQHVPQDDRGVSDESHAHPEAVGGGGGLTHGLDLDPVGGAVEDKGEQRHECKGQVHQCVVAKQHLAHQGEVSQQWDLKGGERRDGPGGAHQFLEQEVADAQAEEIHADAADALFSLQRDAHDPCEHSHYDADDYPDEHGQPQAASLEDGEVGPESAEQHHAVDAEVQDAASLSHGLAQRCQEERGGQPDPRGRRSRENRDGEELSHPSTLFATGGPSTPPVGSGATPACRAPSAATGRSRTRRRMNSVDTTKTTTNPLSPTMKADGTWTALCTALPPTRRPPKTNADRIVHSGCSPPNSAATMPLKPAAPVKPVAVPSVTIRCDSLPKTSTAPARPAMAPLRVRARVIVRRTGIPA